MSFLLPPMVRRVCIRVSYGSSRPAVSLLHAVEVRVFRRALSGRSTNQQLRRRGSLKSLLNDGQIKMRGPMKCRLERSNFFRWRQGYRQLARSSLSSAGSSGLETWADRKFWGLIFSLEHLMVSLEANPNWDTALHVYLIIPAHLYSGVSRVCTPLLACQNIRIFRTS
jgi:hypothetical protein